MSELWRIILTACITIGGGIIVYVVGRLLVALFVEPIHRLRSLIGEIADSLAFYAPVYSNPSEVVDYQGKSNEAAEVIRRQATQLQARAHAIPWYSFCAFIRLVRTKKEIEDASAQLIGLSSSVLSGPKTNYGLQADAQRKGIEELLGIRSRKHKNQGQSLNRFCLQHGIQLFLFGLLLFGVKVSTVPIVGTYSFTIPTWWNTGGLIFSFAVTILFMVAVFYKILGDGIENYLDKRPRSRTQAAIQAIFWVMFVCAFFTGWVKGFAGIVDAGFCGLLGWAVIIIGLVWLAIILTVRLRTALRR